jgi:PIN domain nuclease of toxin-antitoxin system
MRLLIDTHSLIWYLEGNKKLRAGQRELIVNSDNDILVSVVSLWEIAIKSSIGKLMLSRSLADILDQLDSQSINILGIERGHVLQVEKLPHHHRDPFDRLIIAQSKVEFLTVVTHDRNFSEYGVKIA